MISSVLRVWLVTAGVMAGAVVGRDGLTTHMLVGLGVVSILLVRLRRSPLLLVGLLLFGGTAGALASSARSEEGAALEALSRRVLRCELQGRVLEQVGALGTTLSAEIVTCGGVRLRDVGVLIADVQGDAGATFRAEGWLLPLDTSDYDAARRRAGSDASLQPISISFGDPSGAFALAEGVRSGLAGSVEGIGRENGALLQGLAIGETSHLSGTTLEDFRRAGLAHLLAVSGSNVSIVVAGVALVTRRLPFWMRIGACCLSLVLFVLVVGPDPSVLRAAAMGGLVIAALALGRPAEPLHVLGAGLAMLVAARPQIVLSAGLHLSVAATAGIVLWAPHVSDSLGRLPAIVRLPLAVSLAAQMAVFPLLAGIFGEVSLVAPLANLLAAGAVAPATVLTLIAALIGMGSETLGAIVLRGAEPFAWWLLQVGHHSASPGWASIDVPLWVGPVAAVPVAGAALVALRFHGRPLTLD